MFNIISWNVNGIRAVEKKGFAEWIANSNADVICIQETKAKETQLSETLLKPSGYFSYFSSADKPGYSGTAIYSRIKPDVVNKMNDIRFDSEGRYLEAQFGNTIVISAYFPNSQDLGARLPYKLDFCAAIFDKMNSYVSEGKNIVLCGDYNIAHKPIDLANPKSNETNPGYLPEERAWMDFFTNSNYIDTFRFFNQEPKQYTWWSYRFHAREKNVGWRIDYQCVNKDFINKVKSSSILADVTGSDHCPIKLECEI